MKKTNFSSVGSCILKKSTTYIGNVPEIKIYFENEFSHDLKMDDDEFYTDEDGKLCVEFNMVQSEELSSRKNINVFNKNSKLSDALIWVEIDTNGTYTYTKDNVSNEYKILVVLDKANLIDVSKNNSNKINRNIIVSILKIRESNGIYNCSIGIKNAPFLKSKYVNLLVEDEKLKILICSSLEDAKKSSFFSRPSSLKSKKKGGILYYSVTNKNVLNMLNNAGAKKWPAHRCELTSVYSDNIITCHGFENVPMLSIENNYLEVMKDVEVNNQLSLFICESIDTNNKFVPSLINNIHNEADEPEAVLNKDEPEAVLNKDEPEAVLNKDEPEAVLNKDEPEAVLNKDEPEQTEYTQKTNTMKYVLPKRSVIKESFEMISPKKAQEYLDLMMSNRSLKKENHTKLCESIQNGTWNPENGENIKFDMKGMLVDGQHRLTAIITTGITVPIRVCRGVSVNAKRTIDSGQSRSGGDALAIEGWASSVIVSGTVKRFMVLSELKKTHSKNQMAPVITNFELIEYLENNFKEVERSMIVFKPNIFRKTSPCSRVIVLATAMMFSRKGGEDKAKEFIDGVFDLSCYKDGSPMAVLYNKLNAADKKARSNRKYNISEYHICIWFVKAWNAFVNNKVLRSTHLKEIMNESIPKISSYK